MDGTLTLPVHDFDLIRRELDIPADADILHHLAGIPAAEARAKRAWLLRHERALAEAAIAAPGALELVRALHAAGCRLGLLTRNARELAQVTLAAIGLEGMFPEAEIVGRDDGLPKPHPAGLLGFAERWQVAPARMLMVGDHRYDLACGRAAGVATVLVNAPQNPWPGLADWHLRDCGALLARWREAAPVG